MKKITAILLLVLLTASSLPVNGAQTKYFYDGKWHVYTPQPISLQVNGENLQGDMPPILFNNYSVVPARLIFEKLGAKVTWDAKKAQVGVVLDDKNILLTINKVDASINGKAFKMPIAPKIINDRTMIPVRFVAEALGFKVEWKETERIIRIDRPSMDININNIQASDSDGSFRIAISSDGTIKDYSVQEFNDPSRLAVDIKNAVLTWSSGGFQTQSDYIAGIRAAQNNDNPNITRVVADLTQWTGYKVTLSEDGKQLFMDFENKPLDIGAVNFSTAGDTEFIDIDMKYPRKPVLAPSDYSGKIVLDIPMASAGALQKSIACSGSIVRSIECSQYDAKTARLTIATSGKGLFETAAKDGGLRLCFTPPEKKNITYSNNGYPQLTLSNYRIGLNYFNYSFRTEGNKFILSSPSNLLDVSSGRLLIGDENIDSIDIFRSNGSSGTGLVVNAKRTFEFGVSTLGAGNEMVISALPQGGSSRGGDRDMDPRIKDMLVVIDPGHGGSENGATYPASAGNNAAVKEKDLNLDISLKLYALLRNAGLNVQMTRQDDRDVSLYDRGDFANKLNASLFVSVHNNSGDSWENGTMALYYPAQYSPSFGITGEKAAQIMQGELLKNLGTLDRGVWKRPKLAVLNNTKMPAVLAEIAYISDNNDRQRLLTDSFKAKAAEALYAGIIKTLTEMAEKGSNDGTVQTGSSSAYTQSGNINGFSVPSGAKCDYTGSSADKPSAFHLSIVLDYEKQLSGKASLDEQRSEAKQVLLSRLEETAVNKIMEVLAQFKDSDTHIWEDEMQSSEYSIWVRCIRGSGKATIDLIHK